MSEYYGYILFYSNNCKFSERFQKLAMTYGLYDFFKRIPIDQMKSADIMNLGIKEVPTVLIKFPQGSQIFQGPRAFDWLTNMYQMRQQSLINQVSEQRRKIIQTNMGNKNMDNLLGHKPLETNGISDSFSYVDIDCPQPKSFQQYGADDQNRILTFTNKESKLSKEEMSRLKEDYEKKQKVQDQAMEKMIEKQLIETVYNAEMNGGRKIM